MSTQLMIPEGPAGEQVEGLGDGEGMNRPRIDQCRAKNCPHLVWKIYQTGSHRLAGYRRHFCAIEDKQPGNMYFCPLEDAHKR